MKVLTNYRTKLVENQTQMTVWSLALIINVKDSGGNAIVGATVASTSCPPSQTALRGTTDANGLVNFIDVSKGSYSIKSSKSGFDDNTWTGTVVAGQVTTQTIKLATPFPWIYVGVGTAAVAIAVGVIVWLRMKKRAR